MLRIGARLSLLARRVSAALTPYATAPLFSINSYDVSADRQRIKNASAATEPTRNIISLNTGDIRNATSSTGITLTKNYTAGPSGVGTTAVRLEFAAVTNSFSIYSATPPAGNYRMALKVKLNAGQGTKDIRYGNLTAGLQTLSIDDAAWWTITHDFTASGANFTSFAIYPGLLATVPFDLLIDEVQFYDLADPIPAFSEEATARNWHFKNTTAAFKNRIVMSGQAIDTTAAGSHGQVIAPEFPGTRTFTEFTVFAAFKNDVAGAGQVVVTETDAALGTTANSLSIGVSATGALLTNPANAGTTNINVLNQGWQIVGVRVKSNSRQAFLQEIEISTATTAFTSIVARLLRINGQTSTSPVKGKMCFVDFWPTYMSDAEIAQMVITMRQKVALIGETMGTFDNFYIAEGDSRTALTTSSYAFLMGNAGEFTPNLFMRNFAVSGSTISSLNTRLANVQRIAAQAQLNGRRAIISVLIGVNDSAAIAANATDYYNNQLKPIWAAYRATGAKLIVCTEISAQTGNAGYEAQRQVLNGLIRGDTSLYDALCDFDSDVEMGDPNSLTNYPANWTDSLHPNATGHLRLKPYMRAAIASVMA